MLVTVEGEGKNPGPGGGGNSHMKGVGMFVGPFKYLLLTEFEVRTVRYGLSFSPFDLWHNRQARGP